MKTLLLACLFGVSLYAQPQAFDPENNQEQLFRFAEYTNTQKETFSVEEVVASDTLRYQKLDSENHSLGFICRSRI